jgi:hypothetical protein
MKKLLRFLLITSLLFCVTGLYAQTYKALLCLNYGEYEKVYDTITVKNGQPIQLTNWTVPKRTGYTFKGYYDGRNIETSDYHPTQYVDKNGKGVHNVNTNRDYEQTFYAHWTPKKFVLTFYTSVGELEEEIGIRPESPSHDIVTQGANLKINIDVEYDSKIADRLWSQDIITIRPGYKFLSLYDAEGNGEEIYRITDGGNSISAVKGIYWDGFGTDGHWIKDLGEDGDTLIIYPHYEPKFEIVEDGDRINFFNNDIQVRDIMGAIDEDNRDWHASPLVLDITQYTSGIQPGKGMVDNKGKVFYDGTQALEWLLDYYKENGKIEPNCLTYLSPNSNYTTHDNVVRMNEKKCTNFVLTDRYRVKIPYAFTAQHAIYERDKGYDDTDKAVKQAENSHWGTICLPFPVPANQDMITLYEIKSVNHNTHNIHVECILKHDNNSGIRTSTLAASYPCVYKRKYGESSKITIETTDAYVPVNTTYEAELQWLTQNWYFKGVYRPILFYGYKFDASKYDVAKRLLDKNRHYEICYYKQDKFLQVVDNSAMYLHPYRAYFTYEGGRFDLDSKGLEFNIIDDSEAETGIIENTNSDNKLDKIYTLNGIRVNTMQKGQMYIVNGKKFVY